MKRDIKFLIENFNKNSQFVFSSGRYIFFSPALFFVLLGFAILLAPKLFLFFIATFFFTVGCLAAVLIWKFLQFKNKFEKISKEFKGQVIVQGVRVDGIRKSEKFSQNQGQQNQSQNKNFSSRQTNLFEEQLTGELSLTDLTAKETKKIIFH